MVSLRIRSTLFYFLSRRKRLNFVVITMLLVGFVIGGIGYYRKDMINSTIKYFTQSHTILDINFRYIRNPGNICSVKFKEERKSILTVVHSSRRNFIARHLIRQTYGSVHTYNDWDIQVVFSVGMASRNEDNVTEGLLQGEADKYGDIIMGNFIDAYRNLTYKHLMGYKWATEFCEEANYYLKADDDCIVDIFHAIEFLSKTPRMVKDYYCFVNSGVAPIFNKGIKWTVTRDEYPADVFPDYCGFAAYIVGAATLKRILAVSLTEKYLFIDDVFVTGMLRDHVNREEKIPENKINFVSSRAWPLRDTNRKSLEVTILNKNIFNVIDESRLPRRSCWVWDLILKSRELSNVYPSTCSNSSIVAVD